MNPNLQSRIKTRGKSTAMSYQIPLFQQSQENFEEEEDNQSQKSDHNEQSLKPRELYTLSVPVLNLDGTDKMKEFHYSPESNCCIFQLHFCLSSDATLKNEADFRALLGNARTYSMNLSKVLAQQTERVQETNQMNGFHEGLSSIGLKPEVKEQHLVGTENCYPKLAEFSGTEFTALRDYLDKTDKIRESRMYYFASGMLDFSEHLYTEGMSKLEIGTWNYCQKSTAFFVRYRVIEIMHGQGGNGGGSSPVVNELKEESNESEEFITEAEKERIEAFMKVDQLLSLFIKTIMKTGLFDQISIVKSQNFSFVMSNWAIILDSYPRVLVHLAPKLRKAIEALSMEDFTIFELDKAVQRVPGLFEHIVMYLFTEIDKTELSFLRGLAYLEYYVENKDEECSEALLLADLYEHLFPTKLQNEDKILMYYQKAYNCTDEFTSTAALQRVNIIYQRRFWRLQKGEKLNEVGQQQLADLYSEVYEVNKTLAEWMIEDSMRFMLNHHFRCLDYVINPDSIQIGYSTTIENILLNRRLALKQALPYFQFFSVMGDRTEIIKQYFEVLMYMNMTDAYQISHRIGLFVEKSVSYAKRFLEFAMVKQAGLGGDVDLEYALPVYQNNYFEAIYESVLFENYLEVGIQLYNMAVLMRDSSAHKQSQVLFRWALAFWVDCDEYKTMSKKLLFYICSTLSVLDRCFMPEKSKLDMSFQELAQVLWMKSYFRIYDTTEDYIYHFKIEKGIAEHLPNNIDLRNEMDDDFSTTDFNTIIKQTLVNSFSFSNNKWRIEKEMPHKREIKGLLTQLSKCLSLDEKFAITKERIIGEITPMIQKLKDELKEVIQSNILGEFNLNKNQIFRREQKRGSCVIDDLKLTGNAIIQGADFKDFDQRAITMGKNQMMKEFRKTLLGKPYIRVFDKEQLVFDRRDDLPFYMGINAYKGHFLENNQLFRVFEIDVLSQTHLETITNNLLWMNTWNPFLLNYFGIVTEIDDNLVFKIYFLSEYFDSFSMDSDYFSVWKKNNISNRDKCRMFMQLIKGIQAMHVIGKPHFLVTPRHMAISQGSNLKLIVPFFMSYFNNPEEFVQQALYRDLIFMSPNIVQSLIFPKRDFKVFEKGISKVYRTFLQCDVWSLAVIFIEILTRKTFLENVNINNLTIYKEVIEKKSTLTKATHSSLKKMKEELTLKFPESDLMRMLTLNMEERLSIFKVCEVFELYFSSSPNLQFDYTVFSRIDYAKKEIFGSAKYSYEEKEHYQNLQKAGEKKKIYLSCNMEYNGALKKNNYPEGAFTVSQGSQVILAGEMDADSQIVGSLVKYFDKDHSVEYTIEPKGKVKKAVLTDYEGQRELVIEKDNLITKPGLITEAFKQHSSTKLYDELTSDRKKGIALEKEDILQGLGGVFFRKSIMAKPKDLKESKSQMKNLGVSMDQAEKGYLLNEAMNSDNTKYKRKEERMKTLSYKEIELILKDLIWKNKKSPFELKEKSGVSNEICLDPFGFAIWMGYNHDEDVAIYEEGVVAQGLRFDEYSETIIFNPKVHKFIFLRTNLFEHSLLDSPKEISGFHNFYETVLMSKNYEYAVVSNINGDQFRGRIRQGKEYKGDVLSLKKNRSYKLLNLTGYKHYGKFAFDKPLIYEGMEFRLEYEGELFRSEMDGKGKIIRLKSGTSGGAETVYEGGFMKDMLHGIGVMNYVYERAVFTGVFRRGDKAYGCLETKDPQSSGKLIYEGVFMPTVGQKESELDINLQIKNNENLEFQVEGSVRKKKELYPVRFGLIGGPMAQIDGLYKIKYSDLGYYHGHFKEGLKHGAFVLRNHNGNEIKGYWEDLTVYGMIIWKAGSDRLYSIGQFGITDSGELEQINFGRIITREEGGLAYYEGQIKDNKYHGHGRIERNGLDGRVSYYEGEFYEGKYNGYGELYDCVTDTYIRGQFVNNLAHGLAIYTSKTQRLEATYFEGQMKSAIVPLSEQIVENERKEKQRLTIYKRVPWELISDVVRDRKNNYNFKGKCYALLSADGSEPPKEDRFEYYGEIARGAITGYGVLVRSDEYFYEGEFSLGELSGIGRMSLRGKTNYTGVFERSQMTGIGCLKEEHSRFEGLFERGRRKDDIIHRVRNVVKSVSRYEGGRKHGVSIARIEETVADPKGAKKKIQRFQLANFVDGLPESITELESGEPIRAKAEVLFAL